MIDFAIGRCTKRCAKTERELRAGETYYSTLVAQGSEVVRVDYSEEAWDGPPDDAIGFWKSRMPQADGSKVSWAPNDVMLDYFERLADVPEKADVRFVLALLLVRRRILRLEETETVDDVEHMVLHGARNDKDYRVMSAAPTAARAKAIQDELAQLLFADAQ